MHEQQGVNQGKNRVVSCDIKMGTCSKGGRNMCK